MNKTRTIAILCICIIFSVKVFSQDIHFSQYNNAPLLINPANAGSFEEDYRAIINYKNQWSSIANAYETFGISYDRKFLKKDVHTGYFGAGINVVRDVAGETKFAVSNASLSLDYHVPVSMKQYFTGALQLGVVQHSIDESTFKWDNQYVGESGFDQSIASGEPVLFDNTLAGDISAGVLWAYDSRESFMTANNGLNINVGFAGYHLNRPLISLYESGNNRLYSRYVLHGNAYIGLSNSNLGLMPSTLFMLQGRQKEFVFGSLLRYSINESSKYTRLKRSSSVAFGGSYRIGDAFILESQFEVSGFIIGFSYDINTSALKSVTYGRGGMELVVKYKGFKSPSVSKY